jgi:hypothetical protein
MSEQCLDYYLFSIKFQWVLYNWQTSWHSFKAGFRKAVWEAIGMKIYFSKVWGVSIKWYLWVGLHVNFDKVLGWHCKSGSPIDILSKTRGAFHETREVVWSNSIFTKFERVFIKLPEWWLDYIIHRLLQTLHRPGHNDLHHNFM